MDKEGKQGLCPTLVSPIGVTSAIILIRNISVGYHLMLPIAITIYCEYHFSPKQHKVSMHTEEYDIF